MTSCIQITDLGSIHLDQEYRCSVCFEDAKDSSKKTWFYHNDENGIKHPVHRDGCIDYSVATNKCAVCRENIDLSNILSNKERYLNLTRKISFNLAIKSMKIFSLALLASKIINTSCNILSNASDCTIGTPVIGLITGMYGTGSFVYYTLNQEFNYVNLSANLIGAFTIPLLFDAITVGDSSYGFYGACVIPTCLLMGYRVYSKMQPFFRE